MSLFVFSTVVLSIIFMLVFNTWWVGSAPLKMHLSALIISTITVLSIILMIAIYPILTRRASYSQKPASLDKTSWANEVSGNLSTPAAVVDGYNVVFANKAFLTELGMLGMNDQILGMPITNIIHPGDHQHLAMMFAQTSQDEKNRDTMKLRMLCLDGSILPAQISLSPLQEDGHSELNLLQFSSVSSHKVKEDDSIEQSTCQQLVNQIEQVVFHLNVNQEFMFLNASWETLLDYKIQESLNKPLLSFIHPEDKPLVEARINSLIQGKRRQSLVDLRLIGRNGDSHWVELRARNTSNYKGERSSVIGTLTDISHMKITEASLRNNRHLLSTLINNTPGMIYRCKNDKQWSFEFVSDGCVDVTGYEPYEMINNPNFSYMQIIHQDDRNLARELVQRGVNEQRNFHLVYRIITRSGNIKWIWEQGKGVFSSAGELLALEGFITGIPNQEQPEIVAGFQQLFLEPDMAEQDMNQPG
jgi:PAS domain S-box-containing protein